MPATAKYSLPSIVAAVCVLLIFVTDGFDFVLAIVAVVSGSIGVLVALQPGVRGGLVSVFSLVVGLGSALVSILQVLL